MIATLATVQLPGALASYNAELDATYVERTHAVKLEGKGFPKNSKANVSSFFGENTFASKAEISANGSFETMVDVPVGYFGLATFEAKSKTPLGATVKGEVISGSKPDLATTNPGAPGELTSTNAPVGQTGKWQLIFNDEFNTSSLDTNVWSTCYRGYSADSGCDHSNNEKQWYQRDNVSVSNGAVHMTAKKESKNGYPYTSGMIATSDHQFSYKYGYFESRFKVPSGQGYWPALWALPEPGGWPPEIDFMEILGHEPDKIYFSNHWTTNSDSSGHEGFTQDSSGIGFSTDWHVLGTHWEPGKITWFIDGKQVAESTKNVPDVPMFLLANLAVGGDWPGDPDATTVFPKSFDVDYIRVWQAS